MSLWAHTATEENVSPVQTPLFPTCKKRSDLLWLLPSAHCQGTEHRAVSGPPAHHLQEQLDSYSINLNCCHSQVFFILELLKWQELGSAGKRSCCSCRGPCSSPSTEIATTSIRKPSSRGCGALFLPLWTHQVYMWHTYTHTCKILVQIIWKKKSIFSNEKNCLKISKLYSPLLQSPSSHHPFHPFFTFCLSVLPPGDILLYTLYLDTKVSNFKWKKKKTSKIKVASFIV